MKDERSIIDLPVEDIGMGGDTYGPKTNIMSLHLENI